MVLFCLTMILSQLVDALPYPVMPSSIARTGSLEHLFDRRNLHPLMLGINSDRQSWFLFWHGRRRRGNRPDDSLLGQIQILHVLLYIAMGWLIVFFWAISSRSCRRAPSYVLGEHHLHGGVAFYAAKRLPYHHASGTSSASAERVLYRLFREASLMIHR